MVAGLALSSMACDDACQALADKICECEPNRAAELSCENAVKASSIRTPTAQEIEVCELRLDTCTCAALEDQDLLACGFAK